MLDACLQIAHQEFVGRQEPWRHWSFVWQRGQLIEWGVNRAGHPTRLQRFGYQPGRHTLHAEAAAFAKAVGLMDRRKPWVMVNVRLGADGRPRMSRPCPVCYSLMVRCGCRAFYYTDELGGFSRLRT